VLPHHGLIFRSGPDQPLPSDIVDAACVPSDGAIDFKLRTLHHVGGAWLGLDVEEDAAGSVALALEAERHMEILVVLFGSEIAVGLRDGEPMDGPRFDVALFVADPGPAGDIVAVDES